MINALKLDVDQRSLFFSDFLNHDILTIIVLISYYYTDTYYRAVGKAISRMLGNHSEMLFTRLRTFTRILTN